MTVLHYSMSYLRVTSRPICAHGRRPESRRRDGCVLVRWSLARYRLQEQVGSGGMSVVWRAVDEERGQVVAVKRAARPAGADSERVRRRMRREARIVAGLPLPR
jgi:serine/threonine protein kinase